MTLFIGESPYLFIIGHKHGNFEFLLDPTIQETETKAFKTIFKEGRQPQCVWIDKGKEFYNKHPKEFLDKHDITIYSTENEENSNVVERWNRTIEQRMWKQSKVRGNTK